MTKDQKQVALVISMCLLVCAVMMFVLFAMAGCHLVSEAVKGAGGVISGDIDPPATSDPIESKFVWWLGGSAALAVTAFFGGRKLIKKS